MERLDHNKLVHGMLGYEKERFGHDKLIHGEVKIRKS